MSAVLLAASAYLTQVLLSSDSHDVSIDSFPLPSHHLNIPVDKFWRLSVPDMLFKGPFESAECTYEVDGWVTTDPHRGQRIKWCPAGKHAVRWDVIENRWLPSNESRDEFLSLAREYQANTRKRR
jgi:hypothetical protein